ncbi:MAG: class I SAM-dependent methyltransferase [Anaerolineales bacterium]|nr:class I SAM-dependent methyltransferase [Anaerolineales bacterium]
MAICYWDARIFFDARLKGVSFAKTATLGHLSLYLHPSETAYFRREYRSNFPNSTVEPLKNYKFGDYSDQFLADFLGVTDRTVFDASDYEGADTIHDFNQPIPESLKNAFDVVIDCGALEHIFNFPTAISNLMNMVKIGGSLFTSSPSNNLCGHGFFQFSPELMFRVFTKENGFELRRIVVTEGVFPSFEMSPHRAAYEVVDPASAHTRVELLTHGPVTMLAEAVKIENVPLFRNFPLQSDYISLWEQGGGQAPSKSAARRILKSVYRLLPQPMSIWIAGMRQKRAFVLSNKKYYKRLA